MPKVLEINGKDYEMFTIGEVAGKLDRESQTLRKWEANGIIPRTKFQNKAGRRLYTKEQVEALTRIAEEEGISQGVDFKATKFSKRIHEAFTQIEQTILAQ